MEPSFATIDESLTRLALDDGLKLLNHAKQSWVKTSIRKRITLLSQIKDCLMAASEIWAETAATKKGIQRGSPLVGEEWLSGPYALMCYCNAMMATLTKIADNQDLANVSLRNLPTGQIAARVIPGSVWDRLLLNGVTAEIWMEPGVTRESMRRSSASTYREAKPVTGKVALVLGAGNIASIAPLDCLHKLFVDHEVAMLKMNPVNDYLIEFLDRALAPLIAPGYLRIVRGDAATGQYLCEHPLVETIHITGSSAVHDAIVWGAGAEGVANKVAGTPKNTRPITSELGGVSPTIVVPGPWSSADLRFQAEHVATQKLHNAGYNCIASQVLILSSAWSQKDRFLQGLNHVIAASVPRPLYYPRTAERLSQFAAATGDASKTPAFTNECMVASFRADAHSRAEAVEVFGPALGVTELAQGEALEFLVAAIEYSNTRLAGTLGANILIHPSTLRSIGQKRFDEIVGLLHYGTIAINGWTGLGFLFPRAAWGAFPGHTLKDIQSGIGFVHNTMLFDRVERTVVKAPFRPFPRNLLGLSFTLLPRPPWYITNRRGRLLGELLTRFEYRPSVLKIPRIFWNALLG